MDTDLSIKKDELGQPLPPTPVPKEDASPPLTRPTVRGLATDLANLFILGSLSERDIHRLPKNIRREVLEKKALIENGYPPSPAPTEKNIAGESGQENIEKKEVAFNLDGALLPPAISGVIEKTTNRDIPPSLEMEIPQGESTLSFTENDITLARKEMERQRQMLVGVKPELNVEKEAPRLIEIKKETSKEEPATTKLEVETEESIDAKITSLLATIEALPNTKNLFSEERKALLQKKAVLTEKEEPLKEKEFALEAKARQLDEETSDNASETLLKERWQAEAERQAVEEERWKLDGERVVIIEEENRLTKKEVEAGSKERALREELELLRKKKMRFTLLKEQQELAEELESSKKGREPLELEWIRLNEKKKNLLQNITSTENNLKQLSSEKKEIEEREATAKDSNTRHNTESARWEVEKKRKESEISYLENKKSLENIEKDIANLTEEYRNMLQNEINTGKELERIKEDLVTLP